MSTVRLLQRNFEYMGLHGRSLGERPQQGFRNGIYSTCAYVQIQHKNSYKNKNPMQNRIAQDFLLEGSQNCSVSMYT